MNRAIRSSGRSNVLTLVEPSDMTDVEPVGRTSVAFGGRGMEPRADPGAEFNRQVRAAWLVARGRVSVDDVIANL
jgi:hypothetical protein